MFCDVMLDSTVNNGGEEILEDDYGDHVDDDGYSMVEALDVADCEYIECPSTVSWFQNGNHVVYLLKTGWESSTIQRDKK